LSTERRRQVSDLVENERAARGGLDESLPLRHRAVFPLEFGHVHATLQHQLEFVHVHRLAEEIVGARADRAEGALLVSLAGDDDDLGQPVDDGEP
jgi:hypothetical protein